MTTPFENIRREFRENGVLPESYRAVLSETIANSNDDGQLEEAIHFFTYSYPLDSRVYAKCFDLIYEDRNDQLTAMCIRGIYTYWAEDDPELSSIIFERILDSSFDERFEENQAVLTAFNKGSFSDRAAEMRSHLEKFVIWGKLNGFDLELN